MDTRVPKSISCSIDSPYSRISAGLDPRNGAENGVERRSTPPRALSRDWQARYDASAIRSLVRSEVNDFMIVTEPGESDRVERKARKIREERRTD